MTKGASDDRKKDIEAAADKLLELARDTITVKFRFFDTALAHIKTEYRQGITGFVTRGEVIYIDPIFLLKTYMEESNVAVRLYMHVLLHLVFMHEFMGSDKDPVCWDIACDMAVENIILEMDFAGASMRRDLSEKDELTRLSKRVKPLTADKIYRELAAYGMSADARRKYVSLFTVDSHELWHKEEDDAAEELTISENDWKRIAEKLQTELSAFAKDAGGAESLMPNIDDAVRERYDYASILRRFVEIGEEIKPSDSEFDYVYYIYGLSTYGNMPLIEPLEYAETHKVREIVIAIDTSASCRGDIVKDFIARTYDILTDDENFFRKINIHIIQCDMEVRSDVCIHSREDFDDFMEHAEIRGQGGTDFRPVFDYVEKLRDDGELTNLKGLIYFTDGYGIYPEKAPDYDVVFAFTEDDDNRQPVPEWSMVIRSESMTSMNSRSGLL